MARWTIIVSVLFVTIVSLCYAEMYVWLDENGVKHFTDRPPSADEVSPEQIKQVETKKYQFTHRLYVKEGGKEYCGDFQLPERNDDLAINAKRVYDTAKEIYDRLKVELNRQDDDSVGHKMYVDSFLGEYECKWQWAADAIEKAERAKP